MRNVTSQGIDIGERLVLVITQARWDVVDL